MSEVNKNSSLFSTFREEYIDPYPLTNFLAQGVDMLTEPTRGEKATEIRENYQTFNLDQLNNAAKSLETDLSGVYDSDELLRQIQGRIINLTNASAVQTSVPNNNDNLTIKNNNSSSAGDFAPIITDSTKYDLSTDTQVKKFEQISTEENVNEENVNKFLAGDYGQGNVGTKESRAELNIKSSFNDLRNANAEREFEILRSVEGRMSPEEKKNRVASLTEELKESIGYDEKIDKNMLMLKFGVDLLNARSEKTKPFPKFLDAFAQALAPTTNYLLAEKARKQSDLKEIGLTAFSLVKEEDDDRKKRFDEDPRFASAVMAIDYDDSGNRTGQTAFFKPIMTPAEATFYSNFKYPESIGGQPVPENLIGKQMFTITQTPTATDKVYSSGLVGDDLKALQKHSETLRFLKQGLDNTALVLGIGSKYDQQGKAVFGPSYNARIFSKTFSEILDEGSNTFAEFFGQGDRAKAIKEAISGKDKLSQQQIILNELGVDFDYNELVSVANDQKNQIIDEIYNSGLSDEEKEAEASKVAQYYGQFQQDLRGDPDLDIIKILETTQTFAFARYLQGSNRLLKDVIAQANSIVRLGGLTNSHEKTMNRYRQFLDYFAREYNEELQYVLDANEYEQHKIRIAPDGVSFTGGWNPLKTDTGSGETSARASGFYDSQKIDNLDGLVDNDLLEQLRNQ